jgi:hypothetical protein
MRRTTRSSSSSGGALPPAPPSTAPVRCSVSAPGLGYFAVGIDLNPGERNPHVLPGDFHRIVFPTGSVDAVYTNALDHVFSLEQLVGEVQRLLRPGGIFVADLELGSEEGFVPGEYEAVMWRDHGRLIDQIKALGGFEVEQVRDLGKARRDQWTQVVFRKPA